MLNSKLRSVSMKNRRKFLTLGLFGLSVFAAAATVQAQATRTWVSGVGDDVNPCSRTAPCKTFAGAISKTATGGEINCLDPGGFGAVTITKSLTIDCSGTFGSTLASSMNGMVINIPASEAGNTVRIRGVSINGAGGTTGIRTGINGIRIISGSRVYIEDVVIDGFTKAGVSVENADGVARVSIFRSSIRRNIEHGIVAAPREKATAEIVVAESLISGNGTGIGVGTGATATVSASTLTFNSLGVSAVGGKVLSTKTNTLQGNEKNGVMGAAPLQ
jgi:hypothetical protein